MRLSFALGAALLLALPQAYACMGPGMGDTIFFETLPNPQPDADLIAHISIDEVKGKWGESATVTVVDVIKTTGDWVKGGDKVGIKYQVTSCGPEYKAGDKGTIFAMTGIDSEGRVVLYPYMHAERDINLVRPPLSGTVRTPVTKLPPQTQEEYAKLNSSCAAFYAVTKEERSGYADKFNTHKVYAKRLHPSGQIMEARYEADLSRERSELAKAKSEGTLRRYIYKWESVCPSVEFYTPILLARWSKGMKEELKPFDFTPAKDPRGTVGQAPVCSFPDLKLPADFEVYAAGGYSGRKIAYQIDQSGNAGTQIDVAVNSPGKPVVLILGAYDPTIWNIGWTKNTTILAVLVSGYYRQVVAGLSAKTPLLISSYENKGPCGYFYFRSEKSELPNDKARSLFGRPIDMFFPAVKGSVVVGEAFPGGTKLFTSAEIPPEAYHETSAPLAGMDGLIDAVHKGLLRYATLSDAEDWVKAGGKGVHRSGKLYLENAYVVLKPFTYPAGLTGMPPPVFFLPKGVPRPTGYGGWSTVYDFNTLECQGNMCGRS